MMCIYIYDFIHISCIVKFAQCFNNSSHVLLIVYLCFLVIGVTEMKLSVVLCLLIIIIIIFFNLKTDLLSYGIKYLMVLEYLVSQQYEKLSLMEVEDYQKVCISH